MRFSVTDTGPGISPDDLAHIFEPYWSGKRAARRGTGLDLYIDAPTTAVDAMVNPACRASNPTCFAGIVAKMGEVGEAMGLNINDARQAFEALTEIKSLAQSCEPIRSAEETLRWAQSTQALEQARKGALDMQALRDAAKTLHRAASDPMAISREAAAIIEGDARALELRMGTLYRMAHRPNKTAIALVDWLNRLF